MDLKTFIRNHKDLIEKNNIYDLLVEDNNANYDIADKVHNPLINLLIKLFNEEKYIPEKGYVIVLTNRGYIPYIQKTIYNNGYYEFDTTTDFEEATIFPTLEEVNETLKDTWLYTYGVSKEDTIEVLGV